MRMLSLFVAAWTLHTVGIAQQASAPNGNAKPVTHNVAQWLRATAAAGPTSFEVRWQPARPLTAAGAGRAAKNEVEAARGSYAPDLLWIEFQGTDQRAWLQAGRHTLMRDKGKDDWRLAGTRARPTFLPDPVLAMHTLAANLPEVVARTITETDGVAIERVTLCLSPSQVDALEFAGAIGDPHPIANQLRAMVKAGRLPAEEVSAPIVDVCLDVDVATRLVRRLHVRSITKEVDMKQLLLQAQQAQRGRAPAGAEPAAKPVTEPMAEPAPAAIPKEFQDGLPVRDVEGMQVVWFEFLLRDHGKAAPVVLDEAQRTMLGR